MKTQAACAFLKNKDNDPGHIGGSWGDCSKVAIPRAAAQYPNCTQIWMLLHCSDCCSVLPRQRSRDGHGNMVWRRHNLSEMCFVNDERFQRQKLYRVTRKMELTEKLVFCTFFDICITSPMLTPVTGRRRSTSTPQTTVLLKPTQTEGKRVGWGHSKFVSFSLQKAMHGL